ncbi:MAG: LysM peptidoglycan-binding domain-containing protein [Deltaproteobacteria bacterium]|jgi:LysM repeat protein|nr:LysM peptidoglycan-binding domain-containing protein [Deltaproteobacteria bacterium]
MKWKESNGDAETAADQEGNYEENYSPLKTPKLNFGSKLTSIVTRPGFWMVTVPVLLLVIFLSAMRPSGGDKALLSAMDQRLQQLENRIEAMEGINELVVDLDNNRHAAKSLMVKLDHLETSFNQNVKEIDQKLKGFETRLAKREAAQAQKPVIKSPPPKTAAKTHVVKKGETLYGISKKYGMSLSQLMSLNKLSKGAVINPGQTLKISP